MKENEKYENWSARERKRRGEGEADRKDKT